MLVFRSLTIGLLGACVFLLVGLDEARTPEVVYLPAATAAPAPATTRDITVIDVAPGVSASTIASLVRLHEGEQIVAVGDRHVDNALAAGIAAGDVIRRDGKLLDLTISGTGAGIRRVLVIIH